MGLRSIRTNYRGVQRPAHLVPDTAASPTTALHSRNHNRQPRGGFETHSAATAPAAQPETRREGTDKAHAGHDTDGSCPGAPARPRRHHGRPGPALATCPGPATALRIPGPACAGSQPRSSPAAAWGLPAQRRAAPRHARGPAASRSRFLGTPAARGRANTPRAGRLRGGAGAARGGPGEPFLRGLAEGAPALRSPLGPRIGGAPLCLKWLLPFHPNSHTKNSVYTQNLPAWRTRPIVC